MSLCQSSYRIITKSIIILLLLCYTAFTQHTPVQDDPVLATEVSAPPRIDGSGDDTCWQNIPWQSIAHVWIPYGKIIDSSDYYGRYKIVWASKTNLLYFLVEITDNVFVDGFVPGVTADVYNFDIVEVFIDEDASGGYHVFDASGDASQEWGTNAENAFAYHIYAAFPQEKNITTNLYAGDLDGTSWSDVRSVNYASHFPEFGLQKKGNTSTWEFSLIVYNDTYEDTVGNKETARVQLQAGKVMGLSLAYCDNDDPNENPKVRDKFFGSVWVPDAAFNDHWKDADYFGSIKLVPSFPRSTIKNQINTPE